LGGEAGPAQKVGKPDASISAASRTPPSSTTPATPRRSSRRARIPPSPAAQVSRRQSITRTEPGGATSIALRCGFSGSEVIAGIVMSSRAGT
jgi:hypothetical protein